jgi:AraC-like DNA-binding protein
MSATVSTEGRGRLERSCGASGRSRRGDWVRSRDLADGVQVLEAWFTGRGYDTNRHDTYAIGVTDAGLQAFDYRGATRVSAPGQVVALHPDEAHDGRAATADGFGYRIVYVAPARIEAAARAIRGRPSPLPFVRDPVMAHTGLAEMIRTAVSVDPEPLAIDDVVARLAGAMLAADPSLASVDASRHHDEAALAPARRFLDAETDRVIRSSELEAVAGLTRYDLARQFRLAFGTSPYRYSRMRRLDRGRAAASGGMPLAEVAAETGFADQAHLARMFRRTFGVTMARDRALTARGGTA